MTNPNESFGELIVAAMEIDYSKFPCVTLRNAIRIIRPTEDISLTKYTVSDLNDILKKYLKIMTCHRKNEI